MQGLALEHVSSYLAHKQHLLAATRLADVVPVTRAIGALHGTNPPGPYLSLWARTTVFALPLLDAALYDQRTLARLHCMRLTVHVVCSEEQPRRPGPGWCGVTCRHSDRLRSMTSSGGQVSPKERHRRRCERCSRR
jgi:hypothetical protein